MGKCSLCSRDLPDISRFLGICLKCLRDKDLHEDEGFSGMTIRDKAVQIALKAHAEARRAFGLPETPPRHKEGIGCKICINECVIPPQEFGYCGLRKNEDGRVIGVTAERGKFSWYHDLLPTNCVADWVCAGGTGAGYPRYALRDGPEYGYKNLAVFFHACSFDCLFCQNWHFREHTMKKEYRTINQLLDAIDHKTTCICYFGGDPTPQLPFALKASREAIKRIRDRPLRICWETNGTMDKALLREMVELSLQSGGTIKFDLKVWDEAVHIALTGVTNKRTIENFSYVAEISKIRPEPPLLVASTLLVPGYVDEEEIRNIASFISTLNPYIPYSLLAYYPHFYMDDLGFNSKEFAMRMVSVAQEAGLKKVRLGNIHLLK